MSDITNFNFNFIVDSDADTIADDGVTTLREAIIAANSVAFPGLDSIAFNLAPGTVIGLTGGTLNITDNLTINGSGVPNLTISNNGTFDSFFLSNASVALDGLTITNAIDGVVVGSGSDLTVTNSVFTNNTDDAIEIRGDNNTVSVVNTVLSNNGTTATPDGGGFEVNGSFNTITLDGVTANDNIEDGVFINADNNALTIRNSSLSGNTDDAIDIESNNNTVSVRRQYSTEQQRQYRHS